LILILISVLKFNFFEKIIATELNNGQNDLIKEIKAQNTVLNVCVKQKIIKISIFELLVGQSEIYLKIEIEVMFQ
jgi:hypothetical protein